MLGASRRNGSLRKFYELLRLPLDSGCSNAVVRARAPQPHAMRVHDNAILHHLRDQYCVLCRVLCGMFTFHHSTPSKGGLRAQDLCSRKPVCRCARWAPLFHSSGAADGGVSIEASSNHRDPGTGHADIPSLGESPVRERPIGRDANDIEFRSVDSARSCQAA